MAVRQTGGVDTVITIVVFGVVGLSGLIAIGVLFRGDHPHDQIGAGGLDVSAGPPRVPGGPPEDTPAMREDDIRQMLEARNRRRRARGQAESDVDGELRALLDDRPAPAERQRDPSVEAEARAIVTARNARRRRRGEPEGDVEAEVAELLERVDPA